MQSSPQLSFWKMEFPERLAALRVSADMLVFDDAERSPDDELKF